MYLSYDTSGITEILKYAENIAKNFAFFFENIYIILGIGLLLLILIIFVALKINNQFTYLFNALEILESEINDIKKKNSQ